MAIFNPPLKDGFEMFATIFFKDDAVKTDGRKAGKSRLSDCFEVFLSHHAESEKSKGCILVH